MQYYTQALRPAQPNITQILPHGRAQIRRKDTQGRWHCCEDEGAQSRREIVAVLRDGSSCWLADIGVIRGAVDTQLH
jgi:hypothetical protein